VTDARILPSTHTEPPGAGSAGTAPGAPGQDIGPVIGWMLKSDSPTASGMAALLLRARLSAGLTPPPPEKFRVAGVPLVMAVVVASGQGWTTYTAKAGDTLSGIALRHGTDPQALARVNRIPDPDRIRAGQRLSVPRGRTAGDGAGAARRKAAAAGLHPVDSSGAPALTYRVRPGDTVSEIALRTGTSVRAVLAANGLRPNGMIRAGQLLTLPGLPRPAAAHASTRRPGTRVVAHVVRPGDTVWSIATRRGVAVDAITRANRLDRAGTIRPGQKLVLPGATPATKPAAIVPPTIAHVVRRGETVTAIARRHGTGVATVLNLNGLKSRTLIQPGRRLLVPAPPDAAERPRRAVAAQATTDVPRRHYPEAVTRAAAANRAALRRRGAPTRSTARDLVADTARRHGVPAPLALAVATMESGFDQRRVSAANAIGIMQVIPSSGAWASDLVGRPLDLLDAEDNVEAGVAILASLLARADEPTAIAGYYQGLAGVRRHGMYADTRRYVATVRALAARYE
jgi:LysM repeat protein